MRYYAGMRPGLMQGLQALAAGGGDAYNDEFTRLATVDSQRANARKSNAEAHAIEDELARFVEADDEFRRMGLPQGVSSAVLSAGLRRASGFNDVVSRLGGVRKIGYTNEAADAGRAGDNEGMNRMLSVSSGTPYKPFRESGGSVFNTATGALGATTPVGASAVQKNLSEAIKDHAEAGQKRYLGSGGAYLDTQTGQTIDARPFDLKDGTVLNRGTGETGIATLDELRRQVGRGLGMTDPQTAALENYLQTGETPPLPVPYQNAGQPSPPPSQELIELYQTNFGKLLQQLRDDQTPDGAAKPNSKLDAQLDEVFLEYQGESFGKPIMVPNQEKKARFLGWWSQHRDAYPDINGALADFLRLEQSGTASPAGPGAPGAAGKPWERYR